MRQTILIVDDSPDDTLLTELAISRVRADIRTESVTSGERALQYLKAAKEPPAMILLDLKMPGMDGIETIRTIREQKRFEHTPVIVLTCSALEFDKKAADKAGASGFLQKAVSLDRFWTEIERLVEKWMPKATTG